MYIVTLVQGKRVVYQRRVPDLGYDYDRALNDQLAKRTVPKLESAVRKLREHHMTLLADILEGTPDEEGLLNAARRCFDGVWKISKTHQDPPVMMKRVRKKIS